ncbi:hypothetical protein J6590_057227 [Homalodisca vitripennis]|nr:hypothetical protein J6590_094552 [Homalodisca vitripennis]KAG8241091.1 hypothetical protein J6590_094555 [Homalodisca vitripennis]KAG8242867.1 hypothetical protein J6590_057224 [Homalodisca vitripennis]KAG8242870.1 hypothetical protein J6590_057227 [Homalodisca vitripennis]
MSHTRYEDIAQAWERLRFTLSGSHPSLTILDKSGRRVAVETGLPERFVHFGIADEPATILRLLLYEYI